MPYGRHPAAKSIFPLSHWKIAPVERIRKKMRTIPPDSDNSLPNANKLALFKMCLIGLTLTLFSCGPRNAPDSKRRTVDGHFARAIAGQIPQHGSVYSNMEIEIMRARLALNPKDISAYQTLAEALTRVGNFSEALSELDKIKAAGARRFETVFQRAIILEQTGDLPGALAAAEQAVKMQSSGHLEMGDYFVSRLRWQVDRQNNPAHPSNFLGVPYDSAPEAVAASPKFNQKHLVGLLEYFPTFFDGHLTLGDWLFSRDSDQLAARAYVRALQLAPEGDPEGEDQSRIKRRLHMLEEKWSAKAAASSDLVYLPDYRTKIEEEFKAAAEWRVRFELLEQSLVRELTAPPKLAIEDPPAPSTSASASDKEKERNEAMAAVRLPRIDDVERKLKLRNEVGPAYYHVGLVAEKPSPWRIITGASPYMWAIAGALTLAVWFLWRKVSGSRKKHRYRL